MPPTFNAHLARARFRGALLGLAAGDELGTTLEFEAPGTFEPIDDMVGGGPFGLAPGRWTDDGAMAPWWLTDAESSSTRSATSPSASGATWRACSPRFDKLELQLPTRKYRQFRGHCFSSLAVIQRPSRGREANVHPTKSAAIPRTGAAGRGRRRSPAPARPGRGLVRAGEAATAVGDEAAGARRLREAAARLHRQRRPDRRARPLLRPGRRLLGLPHPQGGDARPPAPGQERRGKGAALALRFLGANRNVAIRGERPGPGRVNYLLGNDPAKWRTGLRTYERVVYRDLWPGIDMVFTGQNGKLKYEFLVRPGARVSDIRLAYRGAKRLSLDRRGTCASGTPLGVLTDTRPVSYQLVAGKRVPVPKQLRARPARYGYRLRPRPGLRPPLPARDRPRASSTPPTWAEAADDDGPRHRGRRRRQRLRDRAHDSADFPTTAGAFDTTFNGDADAFVTKLTRAAPPSLYSTYLGGSSLDYGNGIAVDGAGNAYVTGVHVSTNFPTTAGAFDTTYNGG